MKTWCAVNTVVIEQRHGGQTEARTHAGEFLGQGCAFEKAESRASVKFYVQVLSTQYSVLS
jgi:hypothetical protein